MIEHNIKSDVCFGDNALDALLRYEKKNIVLFTDPFLMKSRRVFSVSEKLAGNQVDIYDDIAPDPSIEQVGACCRFVLEKNAEIIIAFGGGSVIDTAKAVVLVLHKSNPEKKYTLIAIPTTSGTGSEATNFSVITDKQNGIKYPVVDDIMLPSLAILAPEFTYTLPPAVTAYTGMDVVTHLMEAYVSTKATVVSDAFAEKGTRIVFSNLEKAFNNGEDKDARANMLIASYIAGMAFNVASLGINHSIAHGIGACFHISHGCANAMLLPYIIAFNSFLDVPFALDSSVAAKRYAEFASFAGLSQMGTRLSILELIKKILSMNKHMRIPASLKEAGVAREDFDAHKGTIINAAMNDVCTRTNPRKTEEKDIADILEKLYYGKMYF